MKGDEPIAGVTTPEVRFQPYWWDAARPEPQPRRELPARADIVVIGAGFTGLRAALELARAARKVVVLAREPAGSGAARRNAGYLGRVLKKSLAALMAKHGET